MRKSSHNINPLLPSPKHANLIHHTRRTQLNNPQPQIKHIGIRNRRKIVAIRRNHKTDLVVFSVSWRLLVRGINPAVRYEIVVDYGVEEESVYAVVEVAVHVVIGPVEVSSVPSPMAVVGRRATIVSDILGEMDSLLACETFWRICLPL